MTQVRFKPEHYSLAWVKGQILHHQATLFPGIQCKCLFLKVKFVSVVQGSVTMGQDSGGLHASLSVNLRLRYAFSLQFILGLEKPRMVFLWKFRGVLYNCVGFSWFNTHGTRIWGSNRPLSVNLSKVCPLALVHARSKKPNGIILPKVSREFTLLLHLLCFSRYLEENCGNSLLL